MAIPVTDLDFAAIKENLKAFLRNQDQFSGFDFEASGINVLLDLLAYNAHYNGVYANLVANESFIDTARTRNSVVSHAKSLGYTAKGSIAATAKVNITFASNPGTAYIERGAKFTAYAEDGTVLPWTVLNSTPINLVDGSYVSTDVTLYQGELARTSAVVPETGGAGMKISLLNLAADTSSDRLQVTVEASTTSAVGLSDKWSASTDVTELTSDSLVYFIQEGFDGVREIYFGDGRLGKALSAGNFVKIQYLDTLGILGNGLGANDSVSSPTFSFTTYPTAKVSVAENGTSSGGASPESIESIKFYAPKFYQTSNRAVTPQDYQAIISSGATNIESVFCWGGEENEPPEYGKVFISIKPYGALKLSALEKSTIVSNLLKSKNVVGVTPIIVDPNITYLLLNVNVRLLANASSAIPSEVRRIVTEEILTLANTSLNRFDVDFLYSQFLEFVGAIDASIKSSTASLKLQKRIKPLIDGTSQYFFLDYQNPIVVPVVSEIISGTFGYYDSVTGLNRNYVLTHDGSGNVYRQDSLVPATKIAVGTIDYDLGQIELNDFAPTSYTSEIRVTLNPLNQDVEAKRNTILVLDANDLLAESLRVQVAIDNFTSPGSGTSFLSGR